MSSSYPHEGRHSPSYTWLPSEKPFAAPSYKYLLVQDLSDLWHEEGAQGADQRQALRHEPPQLVLRRQLQEGPQLVKALLNRKESH